MSPKHRIKVSCCNTAIFCCYKKCTLAVINERDYIKTDNDNCVQKTTSKTRNLSVLKRFTMQREKSGGGGSLVIFVMTAGRLGGEGWTEGGREVNLLKL
jgi:hypothetical protein